MDVRSSVQQNSSTSLSVCTKQPRQPLAPLIARCVVSSSICYHPCWSSARPPRIFQWTLIVGESHNAAACFAAVSSAKGEYEIILTKGLTTGGGNAGLENDGTRGRAGITIGSSAKSSEYMTAFRSVLSFQSCYFPVFSKTSVHTKQLNTEAYKDVQ